MILFHGKLIRLQKIHKNKYFEQFLINDSNIPTKKISIEGRHYFKGKIRSFLNVKRQNGLETQRDYLFLKTFPKQSQIPSNLIIKRKNENCSLTSYPRTETLQEYKTITDKLYNNKEYILSKEYL